MKEADRRALNLLLPLGVYHTDRKAYLEGRQIILDAVVAKDITADEGIKELVKWEKKFHTKGSDCPVCEGSCNKRIPVDTAICAGRR